MTTRSTRGFWLMRDMPAVGWLAAAVVVAVARSAFATPTWLLIHLVLLGAATHSIFVWSRYFTDALLHTAPSESDRIRQNRRLLLLNAGVLLVVVGVPSGWWTLTLIGGTAVAVAVLWHGATILGLMRRALPARFGMTVRYYIAAAALLPVGVTFGVLMARQDSGPWHEPLTVAHSSVNLLGWIGITAIGTLVTLWPTMLRTRIAPGAERAATRALPLLVLGVVLAGIGPLVGVPLLLSAGLALYLAGLGLHADGWVRSVLSRRPTSFATLSVAAALMWLVGCLVALTVVTLATPDWPAIEASFDGLTPFIAIGFGAQLLLGALAYLIPVALGGGPTPVRVANAVLDRWTAIRLLATHAGLAAALLPLPSSARLASEGIALAALVAFLLLMPVALRRSRSARHEVESARAAI